MKSVVTKLAIVTTIGFCSIAVAQSPGNNGLSIINNPQLSQRILGGENAETVDYPSIVALVAPGFASADERLFCGGSLVAERWVLTAAHCVISGEIDGVQQIRAPASIRVIAGVSDLSQSLSTDEVRVSQVILHPDYDQSEQLPPNDIALLELESDTAAAVTTLFTGDTNSYTDSPGYIAGWGAIEYANNFNLIFPTTLQDAIVPLVSHAECNAPQSYNGILADSHLCAGFAEGGVDACLGDSGGPLFITVDGQQVQAGIVSFGIGCGEPLFYGIYTNISFHIPWLGEFIDVPYQSPELVALREKSAQPEQFAAGLDDTDSGRLGYPLFLGLLLLLGVRFRSS